MPVRPRPRAPNFGVNYRMFRPVALFVGLRYTRAKRRNHFISFISLCSMLGIALGVAVLITVLSVMNGFDYEIHDRIFGMAQQVSVSSYEPTGIPDWQALQQKVAKAPDVRGVAPFVRGQGMLSHNNMVHPIMVVGILPDEERRVSLMDKKIVSGSFNALTPGGGGIVMGKQLADAMGLAIGDKVNMIIPEASVTPLGVIPRYKRYTLVGIFHVDGGFKYDSTMAYLHMNDAQKLYKLENNISGLRLKINDLYSAPKVTDDLIGRLNNPSVTVTNWTDDFGDFFQTIQMEKTMMFVILLLIIVVAAFNLVSSLVMVVTDKRSEIAILRTLGASPRSIMAMFIVQGSVVGVVGTLLGLIGGVLLALNVTTLVSYLQSMLNTQLINSNVYFINYLPSRLDWMNVVHICLIALGMALLATIYPAWAASRTQPAEALRYE